MKKALALAFATTVLASGCTSVPMAPKDQNAQAKQFNAPTSGKAGLYVYRSGNFGAALKKDVWVDGECVGETAPNVFFYKEVEGDKDHTVSTESEFSPNALTVNTKSGENYFVRQFIKMGVFVGGAGVEVVDEAKGKKQIAKLNMAVQGTCNSKG